MKSTTLPVCKKIGSLCLITLLLATTFSSRADLVGPYTPDANTLFLFHFNEAAGGSVTTNVSSKGRVAISVDLLVNSATPPVVTTMLGGAGYSSGPINFGNCLTNGNAGYLFGFDGDNSGTYVPASDGIAMTNLNIGNGGQTPFTMEALIAPASTSGNQEIICTDAPGALGVRGFQFRITAGSLEFNFLGGTPGNVPLSALIPTTGPHAFVANAWYHIAVTYGDGASNTVRLYWTRVDPSVTAANQLTSAARTYGPTQGAVSSRLAIGNENRDAAGETYFGRLDEIRISSVARGASGMQFFSSAVTIVQDPASQGIDNGQPVTFNVLASSLFPLGYQWRFAGTPIPNATNNSYSISSVNLTNAGNYDVVVTNTASFSSTSQVAVLKVGAASFLGHRWSFATDTSDSIGGATGTNQGAATVSGGALVLDGTPGTFMELPSHLLSGLKAVTFDFWATFGVNADNARVFDFGNTNFLFAGLYQPQKYVHFSPRASATTHNLGISGASLEAQENATGAGVLDGQTVHITCVIDPPNGVLALYTNGVLESVNTNLATALASVNDELCFVGRSLGFERFAHPDLNASINELRIYKGALTAASVQQSEAAGPDILLNNGPVDFVVNPANANVPAGQTASFSVAATGVLPIQYQWYKNSLLVSGATNATYSFSTVLGDNGATIQCFATNVVGATTHSDASTVATLSVFTPPTLAWLGAAGSDWNTTSLNWTNLAGGAVTTYSAFAAALFDSRGSAAPNVNVVESVNPDVLTANASTDYTLAGVGSLTGQGRMIKQNTGALIIDVTNNLSGGVLISGGTLQIGNGGSTGTPGTGAITNNATLVFNRADTVSVPNPISGTGTLTQAGAGAVGVSGNNTYTGATFVNSGILFLQSSNALGSTSSGTTVASGGQLYITANVEVAEGLTLNAAGPDGTGALRKGGAGFTAGLGPVILASDSTIGLDGGATLAVSNVVSGTAALTFSGGGTIALNTNNTYSGGTILSAAIVNVNANRALGTGPVTVSGTGRFVIADGLNITNAFTADAVSPGAVTGLLMANDNTNSTVTTVSGPITLNALAANGGHFAGPTSSGYLSVSGPVTMPSGGGYILLIRLGNVRFSGVGSGYDGIDIRANTTSLGANNAIATNAVMDLAGNGSPTVPTYFDLNGFNQKLAGLKNTVGPANLGVVTNSSGTTRTLTLDLGAGAYSFSGSIGGNLALTLNSGTQTLTGTNAYTGNTTVNGGTLQIAVPSLAANSTVLVTNGAILQLDFTGTNQVSGLVLNGVSQPAGVYNNTTSSPYLTGPGSLRVQTVATNPTNITAVVSGNQYQLSWPASHTGWRLEAQTNSLSVGLSGNWGTVAGSTGTNQVFVPINPANGSVFFRLVYP